jgi:peptidoglycan/LPS O-acetylase OafA/YrhL
MPAQTLDAHADALVIPRPRDTRTVDPKPSKPSGGTGFRADIQGLRAVAVGLVVLYHAGFPWLSGGFVGVDVFFVISGFLITQGLVKELERRGTISLAGFYARRVRRILPAATAALVGVVALTLLLLPQPRWLQVAQDVVSSAVYLVNWELADRAVNYSARDQAASPLQHFWSLAVEEQFYVVWPLAILAVAALVRIARRGRSGQGAAVRPVSRTHLVLPLLLIALPSLAWSVSLSVADPGRAYFVTTTRMWELALGAALAVAPVLAPSRAGLSRIVGWVGLALIAYAATTFDATTVFPGSAALIPTLGAVAVLWSGLPGDRERQNPLLCTRPMTWVGGLSYSLYLWHWPVLVIATALTVDGDLRLRYALALAALSVVPAWLSLRLVEKPVLAGASGGRGHGVRMLQLGAICTLLALAVGFVVQNHALTTLQAGRATADASLNPGALALRWDADADPVDAFPALFPSPLVAAGDAPAIDGHGCVIDVASVAAHPCSFGNLAGPVTLALIGDSHADQFVPGLEAAVIEKGWRLDVYTRGSCPFNALTVDLDGFPNDACTERNENVTDALLQNPPDAVLVASSRYQVFQEQKPTPTLEGSKPLLEQGYRDAWAPFVDAGIPVISIRDTPRPDVAVPDCVAENETKLSLCAMDRDAITWADGPELTAAADMDGVDVIDLTDRICPTDECPAVIGGVIVYRDGNHLTATYARSLGQDFEEELTTILG